jgi:hypothetical protein
MKMTQPNGLLVGDKMNEMAFISQRFSELSSQHTAASESRIAHNCNIHNAVLK